MKKTILLSFALMGIVTLSKAQSIPNAGFETWTNMGNYSNPDGWGNLNSMTSAASTFTCMKGTPGSPGASYLMLESKNVNGLGVVPGICTSGILNENTYQPISGFAFSTRPANLTGKWQHMIFGNTQGYVDVQLTRWNNSLNSRMPVASGHVNLSGMAMNWANFTVPLTYVDGNNPDSCMITFSASGNPPAVNDYLYIDNLAFTGTVLGISVNNVGANISVSPNPASDNLLVDLSLLKDKNVTLQIFDAQGKQMKSMDNIDVTVKTSVDISELPVGNYTINVITKEEIITRNFIKQ